ncbi:transcription antitermination factor NusB [Dissulfurirhabdus thermomarina]|uniref:Transcription antitermination protein NusB n=1 Tax=Dissulfurirhabdus thermomarina TaxID=1765737 RepID=A0A6N9TTI8_DISTH|nr:transcription antitermination factor NusB [Dissulfurirhabdus thermomarina]NDY43054.1 transcription antitermination factor NusB [Dissulfurirhabdus thermomarina]NMX22537.1 transcription antitermination factor NusB [Dissulfurirhabdus thermomarina]
MTLRSRGRAIALQLLYQLEWDGTEDLEAALREYASGLAAQVLPDDDPSLNFARQLVTGVRTHREAIDGLLKRCAKRWRLERMARVDRNILRIGAYEICFSEDVPPKVAINEAVELAKRFGTEASGAFVNGILDAVLRERGRPGRDEHEHE